MTKEMKVMVESFLTHNSSEKNTVCCIEEMSELTKVLTKKLRNDDKFTTDKLLEEIAHVMLMCNVIAAEHGLTENDILDMQINATFRMEEEDGIRR